MMSSLPWSKDTYKLLEPHDLDPTPAPTPEQRIRVAAAVATRMRDESMRGVRVVANAETIRGILTMTPEQWARDIPDVRGQVTCYDDMDPMIRYNQTVARGKN